MAEGRTQFRLKVITPDRLFYDEMVDMVEFNTIEGEVGIYAGHIPMTMIVAPGILTITTPSEIKNAALHAGFVEVLPEEVTVLAEVVEWPGEIDLGRAEEARKRAEERIHTKAGVDMDRAELALRRSIARIQVAKK